MWSHLSFVQPKDRTATPILDLRICVIDAFLLSVLVAGGLVARRLVVSGQATGCCLFQKALTGQSISLAGRGVAPSLAGLTGGAWRWAGPLTHRSPAVRNGLYSVRVRFRSVRDAVCCFSVQRDALEAGGWALQTNRTFILVVFCPMFFFCCCCRVPSAK